jgi:hypothetical protein
MYKFNNKLASIFVSYALLGGACDTELAPEIAHNSAVAEDERTRFDELGVLPGEESVILDALQLSPVEEAVTVRMGQLPDGSFGVLEGAGGRAVAPGVWEIETEEGLVQQLIMGDEGQRWLIAELTEQLEDLRGRVDSEAGHEDALLEQIAAVEEAIATAKSSVTDLAQPGSVLAPSCSHGLYAGPSGPVWGVPGATAFVQSSCSGGCATVTVRSQACCNGACTPLSIASNTVCSSLSTTGVIRQGSGSGWAQASMNPVVVTNQGFTCY